MMADVLAKHRLLCVAMQKPDQSREAPCEVAGLGLISVCLDHPDGSRSLFVRGLTRVSLVETVRYKPYRVCRIRQLPSLRSSGAASKLLAHDVMTLARKCLLLKVKHMIKQAAQQAHKGPALSKRRAAQFLADAERILAELTDPEQIADVISARLLESGWQRQAILEMQRVDKRLAALLVFLRKELDYQK
jgi:Lon protease-like protein